MINKRLVGSLLSAGLLLSILAAVANKHSEELDQVCAEMDQLIGENKTDAKTEETLQKDMAILDTLSVSDIRRLRAKVAMVRFYAKTKNAERGAKAQAQLTKYMNEFISSSNLPDSVLTRGAVECDNLADIFVVRFYPFRGRDVKGKADARDFAVAEGLRLQALALYDRLPANNSVRLDAHRNIVFWYRHYGHDTAAKAQTDILAKLIGSNEPEKLFPAPPPCPACGMG